MFSIEPIKGSLYRFLRGQVSPLIPSNVARRESINQLAALHLVR